MTGGLLAAAVLSAFGGVHVLQRLRAQPAVGDLVAGTETWTVEEIEALRQGSEEIGIGLRRLVGLVAVAGPGPDGLLTAPESGVECVWWQAERIRHCPKGVDGRQFDETDRVWCDWSRSTFTLTDDTGTLVVRPADADILGAPEVQTWLERSDPDGCRVVYVERALPVGATIFVHGEAHDLEDRSVMIGKPLDDAPFILSTQPEHLVRSEVRVRLANVEMTRQQGYGLLVLAALALLLAVVI